MSQRMNFVFLRTGFGLLLLAVLGVWPAFAASIDGDATSNVLGGCERRPYVQVDAQSNIFGAGHAVAPNPGGGGGGILPQVINLTPGHEKIVVFLGIYGTVGSWAGDPGNGGEGAYVPGNYIQIFSYGGIAGIGVYDWFFPLVGVFLDGNEPVDPPPDAYFYDVGVTNWEEYWPGLRQVFYVGDGLTGAGTGTTQLFHVPADATRLYLGFADGYFHYGLPGYYEDNSGSLNASYMVYGAATIRKLTLTPATVKGGRKVRGQIELTSAAPPEGATVFLTSSNTAAVPPESILVPAGKKSAKFQIATTKVTKAQKASIRALSANTVSKNLRLTK